MTEERKTYKVLLLDDDRFLIDMYCMKFSQEGHAPQAYMSVSAALDALEDGFVPDAMVFDLVMPEQDGFYFLEKAREYAKKSGAALIALTNQSNDTDIKRAEELGVDEYIVKATTIPSEVVNMVTRTIEKHHKA